MSRNTPWCPPFPMTAIPGERIMEYKGLEKDGIPYTYAWHRCAVPGAACSWNQKDGLHFSVAAAAPAVYF